MVLRNTSPYPLDEVTALVKFATAEIDMRKVCINVKGSRGSFAGAAYDFIPSMSNAPRGCTRLLSVRIGRPPKNGEPPKFPRTFQYRKRSEKVTINDWREALVYLAAHEAKHIDQFKSQTARSEIACEAFAAYVLRKYRASLTKAGPA